MYRKGLVRGAVLTWSGASLLLTGSVHAADTIIDNDASYNVNFYTAETADGWFIVGEKKPFQEATIYGTQTFRAGVLGYEASSTGNTLDVGFGQLRNFKGDSTVAVTGPAFVVGGFGGSNTLNVYGSMSITHVDGGSSADDMLIGYGAGSNNNVVNVGKPFWFFGFSGALSVTESTLYVGYNGSSNALNASVSGSTVNVMQMRIGGGTGSTTKSNGNTVVISNGATLTSAGSVHVGSNGAGGDNNRLEINNASATIGVANSKTLAIGFGSSSNNNELKLIDSTLNAFAISVGNGSNNANRIVAENSTIAMGGALSVNSNSSASFKIKTSLTASAITFGNNTALTTEVSQRDASSLRATGALTIGSNVAYTPYWDPSLGFKSVTPIIRYASYTGQFTPISTTLMGSNFDSRLIYGANELDLKITAKLDTSRMSASDRAVANGVMNAFNFGNAPLSGNFLSIFTASSPWMASYYLSSISETGGSAAISVASMSNMMSDSASYASRSGSWGRRSSYSWWSYAPEAQPNVPPQLLNAQPQPPSQSGWSSWGMLSGSRSRALGADSEAPQRATSETALAGATYHASEDTRFGFSTGGSGSKWALQHGAGSGDAIAFMTSATAVTSYGPLQFVGTVAHAKSWANVVRNALGERLESDSGAQVFSGRMETAWRQRIGDSELGPYGVLQVSHVRTPGYAEKGNGAVDSLALGLRDSRSNDTRSELGAKYAGKLAAIGTGSVSAFIKVGWQRNWAPVSGLNAYFLSMPGSDFVARSGSPWKNAAATSTGVEVDLGGNASLAATFNGEFAREQRTLGGGVALKVAF
ncbi:MAG: extracellular serine protease precursor [Hyphomicrobiales bacterium]|nr:extracellular serine protease precursor [Hyphomicrobiales bacterium]